MAEQDGVDRGQVVEGDAGAAMRFGPAKRTGLARSDQTGA